MQFQDGQLMQVKKKGSGRPPKVIDEKKRKKKLNHVKRPMTAYLYFVSKYRQRLKDAGEPIPKAKEMTQECATKWRVMTPDQKSEYENLAKADRVRWEGEKAAAEKPKDPLRPKRPPSAYFLFLNDFRANYQNKTDPAKEITKQAGAKWNSLTEAEKAPYQEVAKVKRLEWEEALKVYKIKEQAMVANGGVLPDNLKGDSAATTIAAANAAMEVNANNSNTDNLISGISVEELLQQQAQEQLENGGVVEQEDGKEGEGENVQPDGDDADQVPLPNES